MPPLDRGIVDRHEQRDVYSCIPACVELVLKLVRRAPPDFYDEQTAWANRRDGSFGHYDGKSLKGVIFEHRFPDERGSTFPLPALFARIDSELQADRFVIISLRSDGGWHMWVIYGKDNDEYLAVSKGGPPNGRKTIHCRQVRLVATQMGGTDILVYSDMS